MLLLISLVLGILIGLARGGTLRALAELPIRQAGWVIGAALLQIGLTYGLVPGPAESSYLAAAIMLFSYGCLFIFVWINRDIYGIKVVAIGLALNFLVIALNGGYMPISPQVMERMGFDLSSPDLTIGHHVPNSKDVLLRRQDTTFWVLSDIFITPRSLPWLSAFSIGDVILAVGATILIQNAMLNGTHKHSVAS
jgi:hypothetical protein